MSGRAAAAAQERSERREEKQRREVGEEGGGDRAGGRGDGHAYVWKTDETRRGIEGEWLQASEREEDRARGSSGGARGMKGKGLG